jgi:signal transduction histidine kinase/CheY-like chemotaxis protein/HPt (histidine-containing phosphotransfer) domain-containing protein
VLCTLSSTEICSARGPWQKNQEVNHQTQRLSSRTELPLLQASQLHVLSQVAAALTTTDAIAQPRQALERALDVVRDSFSLDIAVAFLQVDAVTALALACSPSGALDSSATHAAFLGDALDRGQPLYHHTGAESSNTPQRLRGNTALLPWLNGPLRGATVFVRNNGIDFSLPERKSFEMLAALLQMASWATHSFQSIEHERGRFDAIVDSVPHAMVHVDALGLESWINDRAAALLGLHTGAVEPSALALAMVKLWSRALAAQDIKAELARLLNSPNAVVRDLLVFIDGTPPVVLSVSSTPTASRSAQGRLWIFTDVTVQHQVQMEIEKKNLDLLAAKAAAEQANAAKDVFLATMSHEIRTPMTGLVGMLELLALTTLNREQAETLAVARDSGLALGRIIDDILDHAKIAAGKLAIVLEPVSLVQLLQRNVNTYFAVASRKGLTLRQMVDPRISPALLADPLRLLQVLSNLVSNAIKFTQEGYVEVRAEFVSRTTHNETVRLLVKDTGIGMSPDVQARVFLPFEQAGASTARLYGGTGLGLSISRRLTQLMGSDIMIESTLGIGTIMSTTITLPIAEKILQGLAIPAPVAPPLQGLQQPATSGRAAQAGLQIAAEQGPWVLAVDDNATNRILIERQLIALGMRVQTAANGQEALAMWSAGQFALILTDCNMPDMDGYALARALRDAEAAQGHPRTPVLGWTANALPNTLKLCMAAGMDDVLTKPSDLGQLRSLLDKWLPNLLAQDAVPDNAPDAAPDASPVSATPASSSAIELKLLQQMYPGNPDAMQRLIPVVRKTFGLQIPEVRRALQDGDLKAIEQAGHKIKGAASMIGAQALQAVCERIELAAGSGDASELPALCEQFAVQAQQVMDALKVLELRK